MHPKQLTISEFTYRLPEDRIAKFPLPERDQSKLLIYNEGKISESNFANIAEFIPENSLLVFNDTKVIHARLIFKKPSGTPIEIFCLEPNDEEIHVSLSSNGSTEWRCLVGNLKRWKDDILLKEIQVGGTKMKLHAEKLKVENDSVMVKFTWEPFGIPFSEILDIAGLLPIPPYFHRESVLEDEDRYQTVYAQSQGSVAAPTAGLHFTKAVFDKLKVKNIATEFLTLHVGAGTFKPVKSSILEGHQMHEEHFSVSIEMIRALVNAFKHNHPVLAVGTTSFRVLESLYYIGKKIINGTLNDSIYISQWEVYEDSTNDIGRVESYAALENFVKNNKKHFLSGATQIILAPPYQPKVADALITNFHQTESTLLLLIASFVGSYWKNIYEYALTHDFRFLSYGDSSILFRPKAEHSIQIG